MTDRVDRLEKRVEQLSRELLALRRQVQRISGAAGETVPGADGAAAAERSAAGIPEQPATDSSEAVVQWVSESSLLPRVSTICFLLVFALALRTLTDKSVVSLETGSLIGICYAIALLALGWRCYARSHPLAPVFTACGAVLVFSIVFEAHTHFGWLPAGQAYAVFGAMAAAAAGLALSRRLRLPAFVGILGACLAGVVMDFPELYYPSLMVLLLVVNAAAWSVYRLPWCGGIRWAVLLITMIMTLVWWSRLSIETGAGPDSGVEYFLPLTAICGAALACAALFALTREDSDFSPLSWPVPGLNALWIYVILSAPPPALKPAFPAVGVVCILAGMLHLVGVYLLSGSGRLFRQAGSAVFLGGSLFLGPWLVLAAGPIPACAALSVLALWAMTLNERCQSPPLLTLSCLLQICSVCGLAAALQLGRGSFSAAAVAAAGVMGALGLAQYAARGKLKAGSLASLLLLSSSMLCLFMLLSLLAARLMALAGCFQPAILVSAQSIIICASSLGVMLYALLRRDSQMRMLAVVLLVLGGLKIFTFDFLTIRGVPLTIGILSFGAAVTALSFMLGGWKKARA